MTVISRGTIGSVGCGLHQRQPGTESPLGHGPKARPRQDIKRPERPIGPRLSSGLRLAGHPVMAQRGRPAVFLYIDALGVNVRICHDEVRRDERGEGRSASPPGWLTTT